jgi:hypothetical protein
MEFNSVFKVLSKFTVSWEIEFFTYAFQKNLSFQTIN